jgi:hypothetical protein
VSSSTLGIVSRVHVDTPSHSESPGGRSLLSSGEVVHVCTRVSVRWAETENLLSSRVDE